MSSSISVTIRAEDIGLALDEIHGNTMNAVIYAASVKLKSEVLRRGIVPFRTGELFDSMQVTTSGGNEINVSFKAPHAEAVEFGARPHKIRARNYPTLVFWASGGWRRPTEVDHPGFTGRHYAIEVGKVLEELIIDELFARLSRGLI